MQNSTSYKTYSRNPAVSLSISPQIESQVPLKAHDIYSTFLSGDTGKRFAGRRIPAFAGSPLPLMNSALIRFLYKIIACAPCCNTCSRASSKDQESKFQPHNPHVDINKWRMILSVIPHFVNVGLHP